jgi:hypothetical protein
VTRLAFRRVRGQQRNEESVASLKAYRVEFVEPLTDYPGTDNGRGEHQNAVVCTAMSGAEGAKHKFPGVEDYSQQRVTVCQQLEIGLTLVRANHALARYIGFYRSIPPR